MATSLARRIVTISLGLCAIAPALALSACAQPESLGAANIRFAVSTTTTSATIAPAVRVGKVRVLSRHVNLQEPVVLGAAGDDVTVTFALRQREGARFVIDSESLEPSNVTAYAYPSHPKLATPPFLPSEPVRVALANGGSLSCWTDEASSQVLVQAFAADGSWRGSSVVVSPAGMTAFGAPQVATADGRRVVVTFFASTEEGFELVAASLEAAR